MAALLVTFFVALGVQCAAADMRAAGEPSAVLMAAGSYDAVGHNAVGHGAVGVLPGSPHPHDTAGHALMVCFVILVGAVVLLLGGPLRRWSTTAHALLRTPPPTWGARRRWPPAAPALVLLGVSRT